MPFLGFTLTKGKISVTISCWVKLDNVKNNHLEHIEFSRGGHYNRLPRLALMGGLPDGKSLGDPGSVEQLDQFQMKSGMLLNFTVSLVL